MAAANGFESACYDDGDGDDDGVGSGNQTRPVEQLSPRPLKDVRPVRPSTGSVLIYRIGFVGGDWHAA